MIRISGITRCNFITTSPRHDFSTVEKKDDKARYLLKDLHLQDVCTKSTKKRSTNMVNSFLETKNAITLWKSSNVRHLASSIFEEDKFYKFFQHLLVGWNTPHIMIVLIQVRVNLSNPFLCICWSILNVLCSVHSDDCFFSICHLYVVLNY